MRGFNGCSAEITTRCMADQRYFKIPFLTKELLLARSIDFLNLGLPDSAWPNVRRCSLLAGDVHVRKWTST